MRTNDVWIKSFRDLTSKYQTNFVEFKTLSKEGFNSRLIDVMMHEEHDYKSFLKADSNKQVEERKLGPENPEWWRNFSQKDRLHMKSERNFLESPFEEVKQLKYLVWDCLKKYISIFSKEYRGNQPKHMHAWPVFCRNKRPVEPPHVHHFNPMNIAAVYYVGGAFKAQNGELEIFPDSDDHSKKLIYIPKEGNLVFFPARLPHRIGPYDGSKVRYSIGIDLWFNAWK